MYLYCLAEIFLLFYIHLKLGLLTQFPASNDKATISKVKATIAKDKATIAKDKATISKVKATIA